MQKKAPRNQFMECSKMVASIFVILIHVPFPGAVGRLLECIARFAVPMFFAISGYFNYQARGKKLGARIRHILVLNIVATLICLAWDCIVVHFVQHGSLLSYLKIYLRPWKLTNWIIISAHPVKYHLWYLVAAAECYLILWIYTRFQDEDKPVDYKPLYIVSIFLMAFLIGFGSVSAAAGSAIPDTLYRNALFFGMPMFTMGIFIREYRDRIFSRLPLTKGKLIAIIVLGMVFGVLEWSGGKKIEIPAGIIVSVIALMLLMISHPVVFPENSAAARLTTHFGSLSTYIYITHLLWRDVYDLFISAHIAAAAPGAADWLRPVGVICLCIISGIAYELLTGLKKKTAH